MVGFLIILLIIAGIIIYKTNEAKEDQSVLSSTLRYKEDLRNVRERIKFKRRKLKELDSPEDKERLELEILDLSEEEIQLMDTIETNTKYLEGKGKKVK